MSLKKFIFFICVSLLFGGQSFAAIKVVGKFKNWESHFTQEGKELVCFALSQPIKKEPQNLNRAEARIFVTFRTKGNIQDEASVTGGYPYKKDAKIDVTIEDVNFKFESCPGGAALQACNW